MLRTVKITANKVCNNIFALRKYNSIGDGISPKVSASIMNVKAMKKEVLYMFNLLLSLGVKSARTMVVMIISGIIYEPL